MDLRFYSVEALTTVRQGQYYPIVFFMHANHETSMRNILCCNFIKNGSNFDLKVAKHTIYVRMVSRHSSMATTTILNKYLALEIVKSAKGRKWMHLRQVGINCALFAFQK